MEKSTLFGFYGINLDSRYTLKLNSDFRRLYSKGKSSVSPYFVVYSRPNGTEINRVGYTVSSKLGHAVVRNRIRRRFREIYRLSSSVLNGGYDIVIVARHKSEHAPFDVMESAFIGCCEELGITK